MAADVPTTPQNGIPLVMIRIDESDATIAAARQSDSAHPYGKIADMNASQDHSVRCKGTVEILVPDTFTSEYGSCAVPAGEVQLDYIRGRGNSTWSAKEGAKNPYKIQLSSATDFFGMGAAKEWALMANAGDPLKLKNRITSWVGEQMGLACTPQMVPVEVVMTGSETPSRYLGIYDLSELVEVGDARVNIDKLKKSVTAENPDISGGYLLSTYSDYQDADEPESNHFKTDTSGLKFLHESPEFTSEDLEPGRADQRAYIRDYMNELDALIMAEGKIDAARHEQIAAMLDLQSAADYWWVQEFTANGDAFKTHSTYYYKERNGKLFFGPLWDFDIAWSGGNTSEEVNFTSTYMPWIDKLREDDPQFADLLKARWSVLDNALGTLLADGGRLDTYIEEIRSAYEADAALLKETGSIYDLPVPLDETLATFKEETNLRRVAMRENLDAVSKVHVSVRYEDAGAVVAAKQVKIGEYLDKGEPLPNKGDNIFIQWLEKGTGEPHKDYLVSHDTTFVAQYKAIGDMVAPEKLFFRFYDISIEYNAEHFNMDDVAVYPAAAQEDALASGVWSVSDESIATVGNNGTVTFKKPGDVTVTLTLYNGLQQSYLLHIYDSSTTSAVAPTSMTAPQRVTLKPGEVLQVLPTFHYPGEPHSDLFSSYHSEDESIATVDSAFGIIEAVKPGKTTLVITADDFREDKTYTARVEVVVLEPDSSDTDKDADATADTTGAPTADTAHNTAATSPSTGDTLAAAACILLCLATTGACASLPHRRKKKEK
ncbi:MAG: hypothetical protein E7517_09760, partial [Ruminococcaceae bacterium]|nr:hypothetical protein [Oscillospiraceae bacterium]